MDADILVNIGRSDGGIEIACYENVVIDDMGTAVRVGAARTEEHADSVIEIKEPYIGDRPVLVIARTGEVKDAFKVESRNIARALDRRRPKICRRERHAVQISSWNDTVIVFRTCHSVAAK